MEQLIKKVLKEVCNYRFVDYSDVIKKSRKREYVEARQIAMKIAYDCKLGSLQKIGNFISNKDHATVLHACKTIGNLCETDKEFNAEYNKFYYEISYKVGKNRFSVDRHINMKKKLKYNKRTTVKNVNTFAFNNKF